MRPRTLFSLLVVAFLAGLTAVLPSPAHAAAGPSLSWSGATRPGNLLTSVEPRLHVVTPSDPGNTRVRLTVQYPSNCPASSCTVMVSLEQFDGGTWRRVGTQGDPFEQGLLYPEAGFPQNTDTTIRLRVFSVQGLGSVPSFNGSRTVPLHVVAELVPVDGAGQPNGGAVANAETDWVLTPLTMAATFPATARIGTPTIVPAKYVNESDSDWTTPGETSYLDISTLATPSQRLSTSTYRLESAKSPAGPWHALKPFVDHKQYVLPTIPMPPRSVRSFYLRLTFTSGTPQRVRITYGVHEPNDIDATGATEVTELTILPALAARPTTPDGVGPTLSDTGPAFPTGLGIALGFALTGVGAMLQAAGRRRRSVS